MLGVVGGRKLGGRGVGVNGGFWFESGMIES